MQAAVTAPVGPEGKLDRTTVSRWRTSGRVRSITAAVTAHPASSPATARMKNNDSRHRRNASRRANATTAVVTTTTPFPPSQVSAPLTLSRVVLWCSISPRLTAVSSRTGHRCRSQEVTATPSQSSTA
jgi:hypothetical protein